MSRVPVKLEFTIESCYDCPYYKAIQTMHPKYRRELEEQRRTGIRDDRKLSQIQNCTPVHYMHLCTFNDENRIIDDPSSIPEDCKLEYYF